MARPNEARASASRARGRPLVTVDRRFNHEDSPHRQPPAARPLPAFTPAHPLSARATCFMTASSHAALLPPPSSPKPILASSRRPPAAVNSAAAAMASDARVAPPDATHVLSVLLSPAAAAKPSLVLRSVLDLLAATLPTAKLHSHRTLSATAAEAFVTLPRHAECKPLLDALRAAQLPSTPDIMLSPAAVRASPPRLAMFDLDSTLIADETIDELAKHLSQYTKQRVADVTRRAMNGELDFSSALRERVAELRGLSPPALAAVRESVTLTPGARTLAAALCALGCTTAVVSGGFTFLADDIRDRLGLDHAFANVLATDDDGCLTGLTDGPVVDAEFKRDTLLALAERVGASKEQIIAVGDGANDLLMLKEAAVGIAFNAKPVVQQQILCTLNQPSLINVLYILGYSDEDVQRLVDFQTEN